METLATTPGRCSMRTGNGGICGKKCKNGPVCGTHRKSYARDNPSEKLTPTDTPDTKAIIKIFQAFRENPEAVNRAFLEMITSRRMYPPSENANRFMTGGIAEEITTELINEVGFPTKNVSATEDVIDIETNVDGHNARISLKNLGNINQALILENFMGKTREEVRPAPPTIAICTETNAKRARFVYVDDAILKQAYPGLTDKDFNRVVYNIKDGVNRSNISFRSGLLAELIPRLPDEYIVNAKFPERIPNVPQVKIARLALECLRKAMC